MGPDRALMVRPFADSSELSCTTIYINIYVFSFHKKSVKNKLTPTPSGLLVCAPKLYCALVCANKLVCALVSAPKLVCALVCAPKLVCALVCARACAIFALVPYILLANP